MRHPGATLDCGGDLHLFGGLPLILKLQEEAGAQGSTAQLHAHPSPSSCRAARKEYIMAKYMERRYVQKTPGQDNPHSLWEAIRARDLLALLKAFAEGHDLTKPLASPEGQVRPAPGKEWIFPLWVAVLMVVLGFGQGCAGGKMSMLRSSFLLCYTWEMKHY